MHDFTNKCEVPNLVFRLHVSYAVYVGFILFRRFGAETQR